MEIRNYSKVNPAVNIPNLTEIQVNAYHRFLQADKIPALRDEVGLESLFRESFPIQSYDGQTTLQYISYSLGAPRYLPDECRKLKLTYGMPLRIKVRLHRSNGEQVEEDVYLGDIPIMMGGGEFIINGAERVIVSQLHRSPGIDFIADTSTTPGVKLYISKVVPERGSWIEISTTNKENVVVKIDQSVRFSVITFLRAMSESLSTTEDIVKVFYPTQSISFREAGDYVKIKDQYTAEDVVDPESPEDVVINFGTKIGDEEIKILKVMKIKKLLVITRMQDPLVLNSIKADQSKSHGEALEKIYTRLRPGNPPHPDKARQLFHDRFYDANRYRLGKVGRFRVNRKFCQNTPLTEMSFQAEDLVNTIRYMVCLRTENFEWPKHPLFSKPEWQHTEVTVDDIDHFGNRRLRTIDELAGDELRKGFLKLKRTAQERMSTKDEKEITPRVLINTKTIASAIDFFFGRSELSQVVDQTNPLSQLTHERRLSALGPGGLNRKRAGFEVRDVHISHYGRVCPIETPEGANIGLISSLGIYATVDEYGFLITPYQEMKSGKPTGRIEYLRGDEENYHTIAPADIEMDKSGRISEEIVTARREGDFQLVTRDQVNFIDVSPQQLVGVSAALIPFLEHDDANRALMGANMQRQAVPLLKTEVPVVSTGLEEAVAQNSGMVITAKKEGVVDYVDARRIVIGEDEYEMRKFEGLNEKTCLNQKPIVRIGQKVRTGEIIADGAATQDGVLALGRNLLVGFMIYDGYNFEDAIVISERLVKDDVYTSVHVEEFSVEIRETKLGREEFTRDIPNVSERSLKDLDEEGIINIGTRVGPGDILVGKVQPVSKTELSPEEKILHAIFGKQGEDVKNDSLEVPSGIEGIVIDAQKFSRSASIDKTTKKAREDQIKKFDREVHKKIKALVTKFVESAQEAADVNNFNKIVGNNLRYNPEWNAKQQAQWLRDLLPENLDLGRSKSVQQKVYDRYLETLMGISYQEEARNRFSNKLMRGHELPAGVQEMVKVYIATKRTLSVGDKMAGRHGNKGVIARIVPEESMPFLSDGTPLDIILNPLGVPSRMNVGQILETHLGWVSRELGVRAVCPVFQGATEEDIANAIREHNRKYADQIALGHKVSIPEDGRMTLYDGRTGESLSEKVMVGVIYMMKLHHLVDDKVHARSIGPYSLITQQPLGGKARFGGQRFGEMEVWALEAYGAAHILQELLTVKSDDVEGRTKIYESMVKGINTLEASTPISFEVLMNEIRGLGLNIEMRRKREEVVL